MKTVMALSGGMDSSTLLAYLLDDGHDVRCASFVYGSKHNQYEHICAKQIADYYKAPLHLFDLSSVLGGFDSDLLKRGGDIPEGHYTDASMSRTVVPGRNIIFLSILAGLAWSEGATKIALGIHAGDHAIYPDCRIEFYKAMDSAIYLGTDRRIEMIAPFVEWDKTKILQWGLPHAVPYQMTRTCYKDQELSCGKCGSCVERLEAFSCIGKIDPVSYQ
jgi:7-cyano-7-deazaguanine synthase